MFVKNDFIPHLNFVQSFTVYFVFLEFYLLFVMARVSRLRVISIVYLSSFSLILGMYIGR